MARALVALVALVALAGCGDDDAASSDTDPVATTTSAPATTSAPSSTGVATTTTGDRPTTTSSPTPSTVPDDDLPGQAVDFGPAPGAPLGVIGVEHDDVLNVRERPGVSFRILARADPLADDLVATGRHRDIGDAFWYEVTQDGLTGWVNASFVAHLGATSDVTARLIADVGRLGAETMLGLGHLVGEAVASDEPPSRVTVTVAPSVGDLGEITVDVVGLGDDAVAGERLHVFATPDASGEGFTLRTVEAQVLCSRGVTGDGLCV